MDRLSDKEVAELLASLKTKEARVAQLQKENDKLLGELKVLRSCVLLTPHGAWQDWKAKGGGTSG